MKKRQDGANKESGRSARLSEVPGNRNVPGKTADVKASASAGLKLGLRGIDSSALNPYGTLIHVQLVLRSRNGQQMRSV